MSDYIFISHSSKDSGTAVKICTFLEKNGVNCWIAPRNIRPGFNYDEEILDAPENSTGIILILTEHSNESVHVKREIELAVDQNIRIYPIRFTDILPGKKLKYFLTGSQWIDALTTPIEPYLKTLLGTIRSSDGEELNTHSASITTSTSDFNSELDTADKFAKLDRIKKAEEIYSNVLKSNFEDNNAWKRYWNFIEKYNLFENAFRFLQKRIDEGNINQYLFNLLGNIHAVETFSKHDLSKSIDYYLSTSEIDPEYISPLYHLGQLYCEMEDYKNSEKYYLKALKKLPDNSTILHDLGFVSYRLGKHKNAQDYLSKTLELEPDNAKAWFDLGIIYFNLKEAAEAKKCFGKATELDPGFESQVPINQPENTRTPANKRILWIDDHPENLTALIQKLTQRKFSVDIAINDKQAENYIDKNKYDLIITDMERGSQQQAGINLLKKIKEKIGNSTPLIFFISEYSIKKFGAKALSEGATDLIHDENQLLKAINNILDTQKQIKVFSH